MTSKVFPKPIQQIISRRPISFTAGSINGIRELRKTQTRRVMYPQPTGGCPVQDPARPLQWIDEGGKNWRCPYGIAGDLLSVREVWARVEPSPTSIPEEYGLPVAWRVEKNPKILGYWRKRVIFYADFPGKKPEECGRWATDNKWRSPLTMPRWATRLWLKVVHIRIERLQMITAKDIMAEGVEVGCVTSDFTDKLTPAFQRTWNVINGEKNPWASNPWVWCIAFEWQKVESKA